MDVFTTPGAFSWSELTTADPASAAEFYGALFGWSFEAMQMPGSVYRVIKVGDTAVGGIMTTPPTAGGMPPMWGCYVTVADADATAKRCAELGGKVLVGPQDIPGVGRFAVILDRQGAALNVIAYMPRAA
ncbi:VOC family protein [uncultured Piscinibacter sp.]|uniref:VOC family protein n=1 Tax=uncultured Piscinibacter sp. TaxID=1131835 RepID=UPI002604E477|nr:VOC family protein [uncultured Piscinibacter sp.]